MKEIKPLDLVKVRQNNALDFHQAAYAEFSKCKDEKFNDVLSEYESAFNQFEKTLKLSQGKHAQKLIELDSQRDKAYQGLVVHIRNMTHYLIPEKAEIAHNVEMIVGKYGDPTQLPYLQENRVLENLIQELRTNSVQAMLLNIDAMNWMNELARTNNEFIYVYSKESTEQAAAMTETAKEAWISLNEAYRKCTKRINALANIYGESDYAFIIEAVNDLINHQKASYSALRAQRLKIEAEVRN